MSHYFNWTSKRFRVIDRLRDKYPGIWYYDPRGRVWYNLTTGKYVRSFAALSPRYDGDDESYVLEYWMYSNKPREMPERLWLI